jgi:hypothetical protein
MAEQRPTSANPPKKRKEADGLADQEEHFEGTPEAQATKRQRRTDEVALSDAGESSNAEVDTRDAMIADLQGKLRERD